VHGKTLEFLNFAASRQAVSVWLLAITPAGNHAEGIASFFRHLAAIIEPRTRGYPRPAEREQKLTRLMLARLGMTLAVLGGALVAYSAYAQNGMPPVLPLVPPAPYDAPAIRALPAPAPKEQPALDGKAHEGLTAESAPQNGATAESKPPENGEGRFTFSRVTDGYVRLDNRTGQVSFCSKRTVGWTCQVAPEDRGVLENEIARLQEENATLKKELLTKGLPLPGSMKGEPPVARNERGFSLPSDPNIDRVKGMVEKAWRQLVDMISALQKDVLKKS